MIDWTEGRKITSAVGVGFVCLLTIGSFPYRKTQNMVATAELVTHTHQMMEQEQGILGLLKDAETGERGYLLTDEQRFLAPYNKAAAKVVPSIQKIRGLTHNPDQQQRMADLGPLGASLFKEMNQAIEAREKGHQAALSDRAGELTRKMRAVLADYENEETSLLTKRDEEAHRAAATTLAVVLFGMLAALALSGAIGAGAPDSRDHEFTLYES